MSYKKVISIMILAFMLIGTMAIPVLAVNYTVVPGDTLFLIGQRFGISYQSIMQQNKLYNSTIYPGMNLKVPAKPGASSLYTVRAGDSLFLLAKRYGTTIDAIKNANGLWSDTIKVGQRLRIPVGTSSIKSSRSYGNYNFTQDEIYLMARAVYGEARGESYTGQVAIAAVILNRMESQDFPNTVKGVIFQPWAFTAVNDGQFWLTPDATAIRAVRDAINGYDPTGGALYYWNPVTATNKWIWSRPIIKQIGKHVFAL
ncbi:MAG: N-acetylmuramoyl-L-alanine amidase [Clostridia bacterium]|nr:N-acetylmuramoyl-L-alanine amidase [Clostridia bacterium]MDN5321564.1 N-acetylmuramoyl-L-alanine amidase [Clostridia bacterium]